MTKTPRIAAGKTRLAAGLGQVQAWRINRMMQSRACGLAGPWRKLIMVSPDRDIAQRLPGIWPAAIPRRAQGPGGLGARLARAFRAQPKGPLAVIGVDCPAIRPRHIATAFKALRGAPAVIGPSHDGGFWLLAVRDGAKAAPAFKQVRWSTAHAAADMAQALGGKIAWLETLRDIDEAADWRAYQAAITSWRS